MNMKTNNQSKNQVKSKNIKKNNKTTKIKKIKKINRYNNNLLKNIINLKIKNKVMLKVNGEDHIMKMELIMKAVN